jgi:hypothetical protein
MSWAEVHDGIYIGGIEAVEDNEFLTNNKISLVINCCGIDRRNKLEIPTITIMALQDMDVLGITGEIDPHDMKYIKDLLAISSYVSGRTASYREKHKGVLIHCHAGINRSAFMIAMYLINHKGMKAEEVFKLLEEANKQRNLPVLTNRTYKKLINMQDKIQRACLKN